MVPMTDKTTANNIFTSRIEALGMVSMDWAHDASLATDGGHGLAVSMAEGSGLGLCRQ